jgi:hypothetical protein
MHSFHYSRGRILFEVFCALAISASCVGAWIETGAWALLGAAAIAALYGLVHAFDMRRPRAARAELPQRMAFATDRQRAVLTDQGSPVAQAMADQQVVAGTVIPEAEPAEVPARDIIPEAATAKVPARQASKGQAKAPRKRAAKRAIAPNDSKVVEPAPVPVEAVEAAAPVPPAPAEPVEAAAPVPPAPAEPVEAAAPVPQPAEPAHVSPVPLFEPEPFVRQQRPVFGRRAG